MDATVRASAPTRIDLAGGTLDIWPLSVLVPGASTVNVAVDLRAEVALRPLAGRRVTLHSEDRGATVRLRAPLDLRRPEGRLPLLERLVAAFVPDGGVRLDARAAAPAGAGLGGSSTLAIAAGAALARFTGERLSREALLRRVLNVETIQLGVPAGAQDYLAALHGGLAVYHHGPDGTRREALAVPADLESRLVVAYTGEPRHSGFSNWEMFRRFVEGERRTVGRMRTIARLATDLAAALRAGDVDEAGRILGEEGRLRFGLAPGVATPSLRAAAAAARHAGALGAKVCGAGGGGCLVAIAACGQTARVAERMAAAGARVIPVRIARRGVRVSGRPAE